MDPVRLFTIGHSTRSLEQFFGLLEREGATHLVDVRAFPTSARYPHFSRDNLQRALIDSGRRYTHLPSLGGRRRGRRDSHNTQWKNSGFRAYADYMETREFAEALEEGAANLRSPSDFDSLLDVRLARSARPAVTPLPILSVLSSHADEPGTR